MNRLYETIISKSGISVKYFMKYDVNRFNDEFKKRSPYIREVGAYIVYRSNDKKYIGSSSDAGGRVRSHILNWADKVMHGDVNRTEIFITRSHRNARKLEKFLIVRLNPELNFYSSDFECRIRIGKLEKEMIKQALNMH